jgi:cell pole-organizing protein PopZ
MTEPKAQGQEPTMEEILASIRRIISENDDPNAAAAPAKPAGGNPTSTPQSADDGVLELTDMVGADGKVVTLSATNGASSVNIPEPPAKEEFPTMAEPTPEAPISQPADMPADDVELSAPEPRNTEDSEEALVAAGTAAASASAFAVLAGELSRKSGDGAPLAGSLPIGSGRTLEDLVKEMIRPMLREWLDANLPKLVERMVKREIERIALRAED